MDHIDYPYLTQSEKDRLSQELELSKVQIGNWINNCRKRIYLPLLRHHQIEVTFGQIPDDEVRRRILELKARLSEEDFVGLL